MNESGDSVSWPERHPLAFQILRVSVLGMGIVLFAGYVWMQGAGYWISPNPPAGVTASPPEVAEARTMPSTNGIPGWFAQVSQIYAQNTVPIPMTLAAFVFLVLLFRPLEMLFPARKQPLFRPNWLTDLLFFLGQYLLFTGFVLFFIRVGFSWARDFIPADFRAAVAAQPFTLQVFEVILLSDLFIYWGHRLQHKVPFLWRFHAVHHSSEHLDWLAAHREHPLDTIYTITIINLPAFLMGFPLEALLGLIAFRGLWAIYIHSNIRLPIGPLRWFLGAPELHHWHHDKNRNAGNYANLSPVMDLMFGTYVCPDHEPEEFGIHEPHPKGYLQQLIHPFRSK